MFCLEYFMLEAFDDSEFIKHWTSRGGAGHVDRARRLIEKDCMRDVKTLCRQTSKGTACPHQ